jgi:hypothetical protein
MGVTGGSTEVAAEALLPFSLVTTRLTVGWDSLTVGETVCTLDVSLAAGAGVSLGAATGECKGIASSIERWIAGTLGAMAAFGVSTAVFSANISGTSALT